MPKLFEPGKTLIFCTIDGKIEEYNIYKDKHNKGVQVLRKPLHSRCVECVACENATKQKILISAWIFECTAKEKNDEMQFHENLKKFVYRLSSKLRLLKNLDSLIYPYRFIELKKFKNEYIVFIGQDIGINDICIAEDLTCVKENFEAYLHMLVSQLIAATKQLHDSQIFHGHFNVTSVWMTREKQFRLSDSIYLHEILKYCDSLEKNEMAETIEELQMLQNQDIRDMGDTVNFILSNLGTKGLEAGYLDAINHFISDCQILIPWKTMVNHKFLDFTSFTINQINESLLKLEGNRNVISTQNFNGQRLGTDFYAFRFIGSGGFGQVLVARKKANGCDYAIKIIPLKRKFNLKEVENLTKLKDQNVVRYFGEWIEGGILEKLEVSKNSEKTLQKKTSVIPTIKFSDMPSLNSSYADDEEYDDESYTDESDSQDDDDQPKILYIQTEYCAKDSLEALFKLEFLCYNTNLIWKIFRETLDGLKYIHSQGIIHRDIKPANIFLANDFQVKIGDFGLATIHEENGVNSVGGNLKQTINVGTHSYMAPEIIASVNSTIKKPYTSKCDVYSLGVVLFEMFYHNLSLQKREALFKKLLSGRHNYKQETGTESGDLRKVKHYDKKELTKLLQWMLQEDDYERPSVNELINSKLVPVVIKDITAYQEQFSVLINARNQEFNRHVLDTLFSLQNTRNKDDVKVSFQSPCYDLFFADITQQLRNIFGIYGLREQSCNSFIYNENCLNSATRPHIKLLLHSGKIVEFPSDLRFHFLNSTKTNTRRFTFGKIYNTSSLSEKDVCAVDFIVPKKDDLCIVHEVTSLMSSIMKIIDQICDTKKYFHIGHTKILEAICKMYNCNYDTFQKIQHYLHSNLSSNENKISKISTDLNLEREQAIELIEFLHPTESWEDFKKSINYVFNATTNTNVQSLITDAMNDIENATIKNTTFSFEHQSIRMIFDPAICARPDIFSGGLCYAFQVDTFGFTKSRLSLFNGGRCDKFYSSKNENDSEELFSAYGININFANLYSLAQSSTKHFSIKGVVIFSEKNQELANKVLQLFRTKEYPASIYFAQTINLDEILHHCILQCIPYFLYITDVEDVDLYKVKISCQKNEKHLQKDFKVKLMLQEAVEAVLKDSFNPLVL